MILPIRIERCQGTLGIVRVPRFFNLEMPAVSWRGKANMVPACRLAPTSEALSLQAADPLVAEPLRERGAVSIDSWLL
jgi:hypothetical protein